MKDLHRGFAVTRLRQGARVQLPVLSNFGFAVPGRAVAFAAGDIYEQLVVDRVCEPLGWARPGSR